ncbi:MAG: hypothetical protein ACI905_000810 [Roseivirga sp.]|jgi:hypothetical protein
MSQCNPSVLVQSIHLNISLCKCCKRIGLFYKNILVGFEIEGFRHFCEGVSNMEFYSSAILFPNGEDYIVVDTCHQDIQFCFTHTEFKELLLALNESILMVEVHESLEINS